MDISIYPYMDMIHRQGCMDMDISIYPYMDMIHRQGGVSEGVILEKCFLWKQDLSVRISWLIDIVNLCRCYSIVFGF